MSPRLGRTLTPDPLPLQETAQPLLCQRPVVVLNTSGVTNADTAIKASWLALMSCIRTAVATSKQSNQIASLNFHMFGGSAALPPLLKHSEVHVPPTQVRCSWPEVPSIDLEHLTVLTLECPNGPNAEVALALLQFFDVGPLERLCLSISRDIGFLFQGPLDPGRLPCLVDLRITTDLDTLLDTDELVIALATAAPRLRVLHLHTEDGSLTLLGSLFDGLDVLEELSLSSWRLSNLFAGGRLPKLQRLYVGNPLPDPIGDPLLKPRSKASIKRVKVSLANVLGTIPADRKGLRLGVWNLDLRGEYVLPFSPPSRALRLRWTG